MSDTAFVMGGSAGVGRAVVDALVAEGYRVGIVARGTDRLGELEALHGDRVATAAADVADHAALDAAVDELAATLGAPDVWINCAMATSFSPFAEMAPAEFDRVVAVTFLGQVNGTRAALRLMPRGRIVNVGSGLAYRSVPLQSAYCAAKAAINGFTASVRSEMIAAGRDVTLSLVQLPAIDTPQFGWARNRMDMAPQPAPPIFAPTVAARAVLQAVRTGQREVLVGRSVLQLLAGQFALPDYLDRRLASAGIEAQQSEEPAAAHRADNLFEPVARPSSATGRFGDRSEETAVTMDGDLARKALFGALIGLPFLAGLALASAARPRR